MTDELTDDLTDTNREYVKEFFSASTLQWIADEMDVSFQLVQAILERLGFLKGG